MSLQFRRHDFDHFVMSVAKEGKVFDQKKPLQPFLYTHEGIEMGCIIFFFTSSTLTVYSTAHSASMQVLRKKINLSNDKTSLPTGPL